MGGVDAAGWMGLVTGGGAAGAVIVSVLILLAYMRDRDKAAQEDARMAREQGQAIVNGVLSASRETAAATSSMAASIASMAATLERHTDAIKEIREHLAGGSGHSLPAQPHLPEPQRRHGGGK